MSASVWTACDECGWTGKYTSEAKATHAFRRHSCDRHRRARETARRATAREAAMDRTPKPCLHPKARHQHGTHATYVLDRCRCVPCTTANSAYEADRARRSAYGTWEPFVDARPAVEYLRALATAGLGAKRAARAAGVAYSTVGALLYGRHDRRGGAPREQARRSVVEAILAVPMPTVEDLGQTVEVHSAGTRRRLQALMCAGWSVSRIAVHGGLDRQALDGALSGRPVIARTAVAVRRIYDELWDVEPTANTPGEAAAITRARARARSNGWAPALAWDDDTIDNPAAKPHKAGQAGSRARLDLEEWLWLVRAGESPVRAAERCGVTVGAVEKAARRAGRNDVAAIAGAAHNATRRQTTA